ncbi:hypothetical protein [uncultured Tateyamaria sp.]|uniref:hypothetical protein n=1 Tax=uncultured Tateyamaria sp. TaxID=455651 RepID=UPI00262DDEB5|nr:hypothetical protein [uncultured Tateyamaria sp.]
MLKFLAKPSFGANAEPEKPYTRFGGETRKRVNTLRLTRFEQHSTVPDNRVGVTPQNPLDLATDIQGARATPSELINDAAHLHSTDQIPLWVLKKALPARFAGTQPPLEATDPSSFDEFSAADRAPS